MFRQSIQRSGLDFYAGTIIVSPNCSVFIIRAARYMRGEAIASPTKNQGKQ
jgi:hypothetical protein